MEVQAGEVYLILVVIYHRQRVRFSMHNSRPLSLSELPSEIYCHRSFLLVEDYGYLWVIIGFLQSQNLSLSG